MASNRPGAATASDPHLVPPALTAWLAVFRPCFTTPVWNHILVLLAGAVLAPGKRTVTQALRGHRQLVVDGIAEGATAGVAAGARCDYAAIATPVTSVQLVNA